MAGHGRWRSRRIPAGRIRVQPGAPGADRGNRRAVRVRSASRRGYWGAVAGHRGTRLSHARLHQCVSAGGPGQRRRPPLLPVAGFPASLRIRNGGQGPGMTFDLYIGNKNYSSWSLRPWVLMRELNIPFREILVPFGGTQNPDAFRAFSPTGKVPCLVDGTTTVWDSLAITEYLAERHAGVWPTDAVARAWARSAAAEMHSGFQAMRNICG